MEKGFILGRSMARQRQAFGFAAVGEAPQGGGNLIRFGGDSPLITLAPTGAGKTAGPVICNALDHPGQLICIDIKGSVHKATAEHRSKMGQEIHVLDMRDKDPLHGSLNLFDIMARLGTEIGPCCRSFAATIIGEGMSSREKFWDAWAETMITAGLSYLWHHRLESARSLGALYDIYHQDDVKYGLAIKLDTTKPMNKITQGAWAAFLNLSDRETRPSVLASTTVYLRLFESDMMRRLTDTTSIDLDALVEGKPMSIYIIVPPYRLAGYAPMLRLWVSGLLQLLTTRKQPPEHRTLMLIDEAGQLGKLEALLVASTLMREYGLTLWTFFQNAAQLEIYRADARTLVDNAGVLQFFGVRNRRSATEIASLIGDVTADEIVAMRPDEQLLLIEGKVQVTKQVRYYQDKLFAGLYPGAPKRKDGEERYV